jgi:hypothetical protein
MSPTIGADVSDDFKERIDEYRETDESRSACVRRLIRTGIDAKENRHTITPPMMVAWAGSLFLAALYNPNPRFRNVLGGIGLVLFLASIVYMAYDG